MARYIDADKLKEHLEDFSKWCRDGRKQGVDFVLDCPLPNTPTADVVEVKHSRWEKIGDFVVCNICGTSPAYYEPKPNNPKGYPPYCHNCGAKMDGRSDT